MKIQIKKLSRPMTLIFGIIPILTLTNQKKINLNFDSLFPKSAFENVLNESMQILGEIENIHETGEVEKSFDCINDIIVGKLFHIRVCVESFQDQMLPAQEEDLGYLMKLLEKISYEYKKIFSFRVKRAKTSYVFELIKNIKSKLEKSIRGLELV